MDDFENPKAKKLRDMAQKVMSEVSQREATKIVLTKTEVTSLESLKNAARNYLKAVEGDDNHNYKEAECSLTLKEIAILWAQGEAIQKVEEKIIFPRITEEDGLYSEWTMEDYIAWLTKHGCDNCKKELNKQIGGKLCSTCLYKRDEYARNHPQG